MMLYTPSEEQLAEHEAYCCIYCTLMDPFWECISKWTTYHHVPMTALYVYQQTSVDDEYHCVRWVAHVSSTELLLACSFSSWYVCGFHRFNYWVNLLLSAFFYIVTKTVCHSICTEWCSELNGFPFCCSTVCAVGCRGGITESHCVVSMKGVGWSDGGRVKVRKEGEGWEMEVPGWVKGGNGSERDKGGDQFRRVKGEGGLTFWLSAC